LPNPPIITVEPSLTAATASPTVSTKFSIAYAFP
jgi:hypothetical protein